MINRWVVGMTTQSDATTKVFLELAEYYRQAAQKLREAREANEQASGGI